MKETNKKKICINFLHPILYKINNNEDKLKKALNMLSISDMEYEFSWGEEYCDYLFVSESIYYGEYNKETRCRFNKIMSKCNPTLIFHAGECIEPDFNIFDYAVVFDKDLTFGDRCCRMPFKLRFYNMYIKQENDIKTVEEAKKELENKKYFCNFMYSNGSAHPKRDELFYTISKYKTVYSTGKHLRNFEMPQIEIKECKDWRQESIDVKNKFKFSIASENACYSGYTSEKIFTSMQAHTVPIYWGDPLVKEEFNEQAFINVNDFNSEKELLEYIKKIDNNDELWCKMVAKPWKTDKQIEKENNDITNYYNFFKNIFDQDVSKVKRVAEGCHPDRYKNAFIVWKAYKSLIRQSLGKLKYNIKELIIKNK